MWSGPEKAQICGLIYVGLSGFLAGSFYHEQSQLQTLFGFSMGLGLDRMNKGGVLRSYLELSREAD